MRIIMQSLCMHFICITRQEEEAKNKGKRRKLTAVVRYSGYDGVRQRSACPRCPARRPAAVCRARGVGVVRWRRCAAMVRAEQNGGGVLCAWKCEEAKEKMGNELRGKEFTTSLLFIPSKVTSRAHDPLRTNGMDRGLTAPRSAT